jgi:hypothetical protein
VVHGLRAQAWLRPVRHLPPHRGSAGAGVCGETGGIGRRTG